LISCRCRCQGHQDFVNCLAVSPSGNFVVSASHDRSVRLWEKSEEILVLSEEREMVGSSYFGFSYSRNLEWWAHRQAMLIWEGWCPTERRNSNKFKESWNTQRYL